MDKGTLSFALDGEFMGLAFQDEQLKEGPVYPAISLLHIAGCTLVSGLEKPSYFP
jgi:E3 ubiquitin-protein ligase NRDP1